MWRSLGALIIAGAFSACSPSGSQGTADCAVAIRYEGIIYVDGGFSDRAVERLGRADMASCGDNGPDPRGAYFEDDPERVSVWSFPGYDPAEVVGLQESGPTIRVLFAGDLSDSAKRQIRQSGLLDVG